MAQSWGESSAALVLSTEPISTQKPSASGMGASQTEPVGVGTGPGESGIGGVYPGSPPAPNDRSTRPSKRHRRTRAPERPPSASATESSPVSGGAVSCRWSSPED